MGMFHDKDGNVWEFHVSVGSIKRCVELTDISPLDIVKKDSTLWRELPENPPLLANLLYACCKPDCDAKGVSDEQFGELLTADSLDEGWEALQTEVVGFSQKSKRPLLKKAMDKQKIVETKAMELAMAKMDDPVLMQQIQVKMERDLNAALLGSGLISATNSPESSASTQTPMAIQNST